MSAPELTLFYDAACPLCRREVAWLARRDAGRGRLGLVDISAPDFVRAPGAPDHETLMRRLHAQLPDGSWVDGVEAFRRAYAAVGLGWLLAWTRLPLLSGFADAGYRWFARNRLRLTGRAHACEAGSCRAGPCRYPRAPMPTRAGGPDACPPAPRGG